MSTKKQEEGDSERRQLDAAHAWAKANGCELDDHLRDIGVSAHRGKHRKKGALSGFLTKVHRGEIEPNSILIVENIDRLSREPVMTAFDTFREIIRSGITLVLLDLKWELDEAGLNRESWRINALISMMERAHSESATKSKRGLEAFEQKRKEAVNGVVFTATGPAWLRLTDERRWVAIPERTAIVREIFELAAKGWGSYKIAKALNQRTVSTFGGGEAWQSSYVSKILRNEAVVGTWHPRREDAKGNSRKIGDAIPNYFPAVIDKSVWLTVQRTTLPRILPGAKGKYFSNLFTGVCRCSECGGPMHVFSVQRKNRQKHSYLICSTKKRGLACTAERNFRLDLIEDGVLATINVELERVVVDQDAKSKERKIAGHLGEAEYKIILLSQERDTIGSSLGHATPASIPYVMKLMNDKSAEITALVSRIEALKAELALCKRSHKDIAANLTRLRQNLESATVEEKYELRQRLSMLLKNFIDRMECDPKRHEIRVVSGTSEYVFKGTGGLDGVRLPWPRIEHAVLDDWRTHTQTSVIELGDRLQFETVEAAVLFKIQFAGAL